MSEHRPFRLAFREEGEFVNCYLAKPDTMTEAILLGSMRLTLLEAPGMFNRYKEFMQAWAAQAIELVYKETPTFEEERAPEHERAGKA